MMALDQSALLEVLEALKAAEVDDRIRQAAETIYEALIEAGLSSVIARCRTSGPVRGPPTVMGTGSGPCRARLGTWSCGSRSCGPGRSFPRCWSVGGGWISRCSR